MTCATTEPYLAAVRCVVQLAFREAYRILPEWGLDEVFIVSFFKFRFGEAMIKTVRHMFLI